MMRALARHMMGGYKGAMNGVKWQGLKICEDVHSRSKVQVICCDSKMLSCGE